MKKPLPHAWKPGQSGNPKGRRPGQSPIAKMRETLSADVPEILAGLVEAAKKGDVQAARLILERVLPPLKASEQAQAVSLPDGTLTDQGRAVLAAVAAGVLAPGQGSQLITAIGTLAKISELDELDARLKVLEADRGNN